MPQMRKRGKYIFGKSLIRDDCSIQFPEQAIQEYDIASEGKIYLVTGSKKTGGFCVTRKGLLASSKLGHILNDNPQLRDYASLEKDMKLLSIRSSDIAFTMGAFGPLLEESLKHENEIKVY